MQLTTCSCCTQHQYLYGITTSEKGNGKGKGRNGNGSQTDNGNGSKSDKKCDDDYYPDSCNSIQKIPKKINKTNTVSMRSRSEHWRFYCDVFENYYATSHCTHNRCSDAVPPYDMQFKNPAFDEMERGICLLLQFHNDICPYDPEVACECDSLFEWNPQDERCERYDGDTPGDDLALIGYCEKLTGGTWPASEEVSNQCLRGCTRYIAAEGYACCPHTCDCTAQYRRCPTESCAYCRSCCESCEGCAAPDVCQEAPPCNQALLGCPCQGQPDCFCETIEPCPNAGEEPEDNPDVFTSPEDISDETEAIDVDSFVASGSSGGQENISNDEGKTTTP